MAIGFNELVSSLDFLNFEGDELLKSITESTQESLDNYLGNMSIEQAKILIEKLLGIKIYFGEKEIIFEKLKITHEGLIKFLPFMWDVGVKAGIYDQPNRPQNWNEFQEFDTTNLIPDLLSTEEAFELLMKTNDSPIEVVSDYLSYILGAATNDSASQYMNELLGKLNGVDLNMIGAIEFLRSVQKNFNITELIPFLSDAKLKSKNKRFIYHYSPDKEEVIGDTRYKGIWLKMSRAAFAGAIPFNVHAWMDSRVQYEDDEIPEIEFLGVNPIASVEA